MAVRWQDEVRMVYTYYDQEKSEWEKINGKELGFMHWAYYLHKYSELRKMEDRPLSDSFEKVEGRIRKLHPKAWSWASDRYEKNKFRG